MAVSTSPVVMRSHDDGILTLTLNRPEVLNGLTDEVLDAITDGCSEAASNDELRAVIITGAGRGFCSGQDLRTDLGERGIDVGGHLRDHYVPMIMAIRRLEKPVIAAVNGVAAGAGMSLALAADFRIAAESARFVQAFVRIGLVPDSGSTYFLPRLIGVAKSLELAMLGETVDADHALQLGLVHRVVPDEELPSAARAFAVRLTHGPRSLGLIKRLLTASLDSDLASQLEAEELAQLEATTTDDFREGVTAFLEKRPASFTGH